MEYKQRDILPDVWVMEPKKFTDDRGYFMETWRKADFEAHLGYAVEFVQENESKSTYGVLRGLHYQKGDASETFHGKTGQTTDNTFVPVQESKKILRNGQLLIIRGEKIYTITGQIVE